MGNAYLGWPTVTAIIDTQVLTQEHTAPVVARLLCKAQQGNTSASAERPKEGHYIATTAMPFEAYEHINLNEVDISIKAVEQNVYTLEINKLEPVYRTVKSPTSELVGQSCLVLRGSFTIVDDDTFSGRKLWQDFWTPFAGAKKDLKRILLATGVQQAEGQDLPDWASSFATLNPSARFQVMVEKVADKRDPTAPPVNRINFFSAKPC